MTLATLNMLKPLTTSLINFTMLSYYLERVDNFVARFNIIVILTWCAGIVKYFQITPLFALFTILKLEYHPFL
jgi:hypothetical protein